MSDEEKKNGKYEKPESHEIGEDDLEGVAGGVGESATPTQCDTGMDASACRTGPNPKSYTCTRGGVASGERTGG